eukprot:gb/GECG01012273.1/.p1 GENE.gb/GECG01012273.1/~~gb/GECG01012273.1/.p1  ORF type:complete len:583 (+),score=79.97 gb/GECG01012273.1/:1-1749(+)
MVSRSVINDMASSFLASATSDDPLIGKTLRIQQASVYVNKALADGGFGKVYLVSDASRGGQQYVLKHMYIQGEESKRQLKQEIEIMGQLSHENIIRFLGYSAAKGNQVFLLMEYCPGGHLLDVINSLSPGTVTTNTVLTYFTPIAKAVAHMHAQNPSIAHRDLKFENILIASDNSLKLCDFGSASKRQGKIQSKQERADEEDTIERFTTPTYRAPEMVDLYSGSPIDERVDIWALGCILYGLMYQEHPFQDTGTLAILSGRVKLKEFPRFPTKLKDLALVCFRLSPEERPTADSIVKYCEQFREGLRRGQDPANITLPPLLTKDGRDCIEVMEETTVNEMDDMFSQAELTSGSQKQKKKGKKKNKSRQTQDSATPTDSSCGGTKSALLQSRLQGKTQTKTPSSNFGIRQPGAQQDTEEAEDSFDPFDDAPDEDIWDTGNNTSKNHGGSGGTDEFDPFESLPNDSAPKGKHKGITPHRPNQLPQKSKDDSQTKRPMNSEDVDILGGPILTEEEDLLGNHSSTPADSRFASAPGRPVHAYGFHGYGGGSSPVSSPGVPRQLSAQSYGFHGSSSVPRSPYHWSPG